MVTFPQLGNLGRIGNQMFQIASTIGIAKANGMEVFFPDWPFDQFLNKPIPHIDSLVNPDYLFSENGDIPSLPKNGSVYGLTGYFQSEKYFLNYENEIRQLFSLKDEARIKEENKSILSSSNCSIHIRRGDYLDAQQLSHHGIVGMDYYNKAVKFFNVNTVNFIVFSDDINWCKENINLPNMYFVERNNQGPEVKDVVHNKISKANDIFDLFLMSYCDNHIITNSSFSWWGAWLNKKTSKKVIAPKQWLVNDKCVDLIPKQWVRI